MDFPNYEIFTDIDLAHSDFILKLVNVIDAIALFKRSKIKKKVIVSNGLIEILQRKLHLGIQMLNDLKSQIYI